MCSPRQARTPLTPLPRPASCSAMTGRGQRAPETPAFAGQPSSEPGNPGAEGAIRAWRISIIAPKQPKFRSFPIKIGTDESAAQGVAGAAPRPRIARVECEHALGASTKKWLHVARCTFRARLPSVPIASLRSHVWNREAREQRNVFRSANRNLGWRTAELSPRRKRTGRRHVRSFATRSDCSRARAAARPTRSGKITG